MTPTMSTTTSTAMFPTPNPTNLGAGGGVPCYDHSDQSSCDGDSNCNWNQDASPPTCEEKDGVNAVVFFSFKECEFNRRPETEGEQLAEIIGVVSGASGVGVGGSAIVMAPQNLGELFIRLKLVKPSFDKKHLKDMVDSVARRSYRSAHITVYRSFSTAPSVLNDDEAAALGITKAEITENWPYRAGSQLYKIDIPGDDISFDDYERMRVELSVPTASTPLGTTMRAVVNACAKIKNPREDEGLEPEPEAEPEPTR